MHCEDSKKLNQRWLMEPQKQNFLESESSVAIKWFKDNKMIVNLGKFQSIILDKKKNIHTQEIIKIEKKL